jgi:putative membrane protein
MMVSNTGSFFRVLVWQWRYVLVFLGSGALAFALDRLLPDGALRIPTAPATVIGAALGIFASFRANAAYARWWEGRQLWGKLVNASRMFASQCGAYVQDGAVVREVLQRHVLFVHTLRCQLRDDDPLADEHVKRALERLGINGPAAEALKAQTSMCHALVDENLRALARAGVDPMRLQSLDASVTAFLDVQGGCERIKRTPMPRGYGFFVTRLLVIFAALFPFAIVHETGLWVVPLNLFVCLGFLLISETGRVLEDPFNHFWNSLPTTSLSLTIERNVRQRLGDTDLPAALAVDKDGILW